MFCLSKCPFRSATVSLQNFLAILKYRNRRWVDFDCNCASNSANLRPVSFLARLSQPATGFFAESSISAILSNRATSLPNNSTTVVSVSVISTKLITSNQRDKPNKQNTTPVTTMSYENSWRAFNWAFNQAFNWAVAGVSSTHVEFDSADPSGMQDMVAKL